MVEKVVQRYGDQPLSVGLIHTGLPDEMVILERLAKINLKLWRWCLIWLDQLSEPIPVQMQSE